MPHPLDGVRAKLDRAKEHIRNLETEIAAFRRKYPDIFGTKLDTATGHLKHQVRHSGTPPATDRLSVIAGEVVHQLRSALNHIVAQLLIAVPGNASNIDKILERSEFPIIWKPGTYQSYDWGKIPGISPQALQLIKEYQPCNRTDGLPPEDHPLAILSSLNNIDKHRLLIRLVSRAEVTGIKFPRHPGPITISFNPNAVVGTSNVEATLLSVQPSSTGFPVGMQVEGTTEIAFKEIGTLKAEPVIPTLEKLHDFVVGQTNDFHAKLFP